MTKKMKKSYVIASLLATSFLAGGAVAALNSVSASADDQTVETVQFGTVFGASVRVTEPNGLRFKMQLSEEKKAAIFAENSGKTLGMFIFPGSKLGTVTDYSTLTQKIDLTFEESDLYKVDGAWYANGVMTNLYLQNYNKEFVGVGYIATTVDGTTTYEYAEVTAEDNVRSLSYVAIESYQDPEEADLQEDMAKLIEKAAYAAYGVTETREESVSTFKANEASYASYAELTEALPVSLTVAQEETSLMVGDTLDLGAALSINNTALSLDVPFTYTVDSEVATVEDGVLTAVLAGAAEITVSYEDYSATVTVNVANPADVIVNTNSAAALNSVVLKDAAKNVNGVQTLSYSTDYKYGDEKGSLKITATSTDAGYMVINAPLLTDVSEYDYLEFYVYNPNAKAMRISPAWGTACAIEPNEWNAVKLEKKSLQGGVIVDPWGTGAKAATDITGIAFYVREMAIGESVYVSSMRGVKDSSTVAENVIVNTDLPSGVSSLTFYNTNLNGATHTVAYSSAVKYGDEKGSFRLTAEGKNVTSGAGGTYYGYMVLTAPMLKDVSAYDYIEFHVYNPNATDMKVSTVWKTAFTIPANSWGTVTLYVEDITAGSITDLDDTKITTTNITNVAFYIQAMNLNEYVFVSSIRAYKNA